MEYYMSLLYLELFFLTVGSVFVYLEHVKLRKFKFILLICIVLVVSHLKDLTGWHFNFLSINVWRYFMVILLCVVFLVVFYLIEDVGLETIFLNMVVFLGGLLIILCDHLIVIYISLELQAFALFILILTNKSSIKSAEASLKYFILSSLSSGLLLLGLAFVFTSNLGLDLNNLMHITNCTVLNLKLGNFLILLALFFKLAVSPLHFWVADIYEGATWDVVSVVATIPKISILSLLMHLVSTSEIILPCAVLSIVVGALAALNQTKLKRLVAYSGISHIGFILIGLSFNLTAGVEASMIYLGVYVFTLVSLFLLIRISTFTKDYFLIELSNTFMTNRVLGLTWVVLFFSIAGIPPLAGFISKWVILKVVLSYGLNWVALVVVLSSVIAAAYYITVTKLMYFQPKALILFWNSVLKPFKVTCNIGGYLLGLGVYLTLFLLFNIQFLTALHYFFFIYLF